MAIASNVHSTGGLTVVRLAIVLVFFSVIKTITKNHKKAYVTNTMMILLTRVRHLPGRSLKPTSR